MHAEDGIKGIDYIAIGIWKRLHEAPITNDPDMSGRRAQINGGNSALHGYLSSLPCPFRKKTTRKAHQHVGSSWHLIKHMGSPNAIAGDVVTMSGELGFISEHGCSRIALLGPNPVPTRDVGLGYPA